MRPMPITDSTMNETVLSHTLVSKSTTWGEGYRSMDIRHRRSLRGVLTGSLLIGGLTTFSFTATTALTPGTASATPATLFSSTTAGSYAVTVPGGVTNVTVTAVGGTGEGGGGGNPGEGAIVTSTATVAPGDSLTVTVGANGGPSSGGSGAGSGGSGDEGTGGGGGSAVFDSSTPLVVAGGGGGYGIIGPGAPNVPGGNADQNGAGYPDGGGGGAGTLTGPGAGGVFAGSGFMGGSPGSGMDGGNGGGGGGGGYFGGGSGAPLGPDCGGGGGGSSYPSAATQWDTTKTPSVTITTSGFGIATSSLPSASPGAPYAPVALQAANVGISTSPYTTVVKWKKVALPKGLHLSSAGVLSGTPSHKLGPPSSVTVQVTEKVTTLSGKMRVRTETTAQATIPFTAT